MKNELYIPLRDKIAAIVPELQEKHLFTNGFCAKCGVDRIWRETTTRNQITGEVVFGTDFEKADSVMVETIKHDETENACYRGSRDITLGDCITCLKKRGYDSTEEWFKALGGIVDRWEDGKPLQEQEDRTGEWLSKWL